jgi:transketolase
MLYSILTFIGTYTMDDLKEFRQWGSCTPGHPELDASRGIENTSGPLGQGHTNAVGAAIAERFLVARFGEWMSHRTYAFISDGGIQEEISQGAGRMAGYLGLSNLILFYDSNDIQLSSQTAAVSEEDTAKKYEAWNWNVITIDGNDHRQILDALDKAHKEMERPTLIIGKTVMGKGALDEDGNSFERQSSTHGMPLSKAGGSFEKTVTNLGGDPEDPFTIFPEVEEVWKKVLEEKRKKVIEKKELQANWEKEHPELAEKYKDFMEGKLPEIDFSAIEQKVGSPTRGASGTVLAHLYGKLENLIVASADLSNSDKTDGFLKKTTSFTHGNFTGSFLQAGVSELTMAAVASGMALHGGVIPAIGTFFVFSDFMKPAVRLAALMCLPVKYVWTHDAFRVGEDGPTHQPVEQEAQIRLLEQLKNHHGKRAMLVLRPADAAETTVAWKMALENSETPTALILSRQGIPDLPERPGSDRYTDALQAQKGAYIVRDCEGTPDVILVASGSEVATLVEGADQLEQKRGVKTRIVSVISEGLFRDQDRSYQDEVLPAGIPIFGMTAGLPVTLQGLVGEQGKIFGMESFGFSAPYKVLDEKLGFTGENVYHQVIELLGL